MAKKDTVPVLKNPGKLDEEVEKTVTKTAKTADSFDEAPDKLLPESLGG